MAKDFAKAFYNSAEWKATRQTALERDHYLCVECMKKGMITPAEEVHHKVFLTPQNIDDPSITLNLDNLVSLCHDCHTAIHKPKDRRYKVDDFGRLTVL